MLTRRGWSGLAVGIAAIVVGRIFAIIELFVIGSGFLAAVMAALLFVRLRRPRVAAVRWVHPNVVVAGDTGRVDLLIEYQSSIRSTSFELAERVGRADATDSVARLSVAPLQPGIRSSARYQLPTADRGIVLLGPLYVEVHDPLGIATARAIAAATDSVTVVPRTHLLRMPVLGKGQLGRDLAARARRLGNDEFYGLRAYVRGDEPRTIDWKASARSEDLLVKEHTGQELKRCTVVFDADPASYLDADGFERGVTVAASFVHSSEHAGLTTRFVTSGGIDLRGPEAGANTLRVLALIEPASSPLGQLNRDPGEGLGLIVFVTGSHGSAGWRSVQTILDPTLSAIEVTTDALTESAIGVSARSEVELLKTWSAINGVGE